MMKSIRAFSSDLWVVDLKDGGTVVACRAPWERNTVGQNFLQMLSSEEQSRLSVAMMSYRLKPTLTETVDGRILIVLPSLMPSATMATVILPDFDRQLLLRFLAKQSGISFEWSETLWEEARGRMPGRVSAHKEALQGLVWEIQALEFSAMAPRYRSTQKSFGKFLKDRVEILSALTGCPVVWEETEQISNSESFDFGSFTSFMMISLLICRQTALDRVAHVGWDADTVCVSFSFESITQDFIWGRDVLESRAEERQMHFAVEHGDGRMAFSLKPRVLELSYLGLKAEQRLL